MSDKDKKPSIFSKVMEAGSAFLDAQIHKARGSIINENLNEDYFYAKTLTEDPSFASSQTGWKEKPGRLMDGHLRQMSISNSIVAAIIQTRQNQVSNFSKLVTSDQEQGWKICFRDEAALLEKIKEQLREERKQQEGIQKADTDLEESSENQDPQIRNASDDEVEDFNFELERKAREQLDRTFKNAKKEAQDYLLHCGLQENRPFESKRWNLDNALRAWVRDTLTYDRYATEIVPNAIGQPHHWYPVDASTIKYAGNKLSTYKSVAENFLNLDILYPEKKVEAMEKQKVLELDPELMEKEAYKYVQVIRGKIERAYTADELKLGIRNVTTDIYNNGYGISELEIAVSLITGHLNAEYYNQAYFTQGFSAKGILHIKSQINPRKFETVRQQWQHMIKGARNSFQTPIFAGMDDVNWIPLTQNHDDIGFEGWMRYLIKMICAIYQIDPHEIGVGFRDEGTGGGLSGDNTKTKMAHSKDKGLYPLLRHIENYINENILKPFDDRFVLKFCGISAESRDEQVKRQDLERKFKKTVNEIRAEDGLPPLPGMDDFIAGPEYASWYNTFSNKAKEKQTPNQTIQTEISPEEKILDDIMGEQSQEPVKKAFNDNSVKKLKVEYYQLRK